MRFGQKKSFKVKLAEPTDIGTTVADNEEDKGTNVRDAAVGKSNDKLGITVGAVPAEVARQAGIAAQYRGGLMISKVSPRGPSWRQLSEQDIIVSELFPTKRDIKTADDLQTAVAGVKPGDVIELKVYNIATQQTRAVSVQVTK
jgi:S1-C subfamily serine protease